MSYRLQYHALVANIDIPALPEEWRERIRRAIEERLATHPEVYGKPLRRSLKGYRKFRVGDYRVIFRIEQNDVKIFVIQHRSRVYESAEKRLHP
ncbi:MAG: type II toxin-antitoxin system RelE/ParE family toxin [Candidatus Sungbacteria bacterium]|nr:type II toxin-antitoxin system RelE/ParE family toxin [Candidatus Sungbacteria bacterium]